MLSVPLAGVRLDPDGELGVPGHERRVRQRLEAQLVVRVEALEMSSRRKISRWL
jgi:hypothetical protein